MSHNLLSQSLSVGGVGISGPLDNITTISDVLNRVITFIFPIASIILVFVMVWGGYDYLMSQGAPDKLKGAQAKITSGIIGFVLLVISILLIKIIGLITGLGSGIL